MMMREDSNDTAPFPSRICITTLIPHDETVTWKIRNVSTLLQTQAWTAISIPMQVGLGAAELSTWNISLMSRNENSVLCARALLISPQEPHRRVTHHLKVAVINGGGEIGEGPVYYFPAPPTTTNTTNDSNNPTNPNANNRNNANLTNSSGNSGRNSGGGSNDNTRCSSMRRALRRFFVKNAKIDGDDELIGDGRLTKEARPAHKAPLSVWKIVPIDKIHPGEDDCIELRVTLTVFGCDVEEERI